MTKLLVIVFLGVISASLQKEECSKPGIFPIGDGNRFLICRLSDGKFISHYGQCDPDSVFDTESKQCVLRKSQLFVRATSRNDSCYRRGYTCADCNSVNYCWDRGNGYEVVATKPCPPNTYCSAYTNSCERTVIPQCKTGYTYNCNYMGLFPDPYKCDTYYFCEHSTADPVMMMCPAGQYYDPLYTECVKYEVDQTPPCPPMQQCREDNSMFALQRNPNIYYICINMNNEFATRVFRCPRDLIFNGQFCVPKNSTTVTTTPSK